MDKNKTLKSDIPVVMLAFILAFSVPNAISPETWISHVSGIALGFGVAWTIKMLIDLSKFKKVKKEMVSDEA
ncbi:hypothetical protein JCM30760_26020 [Thiomicrorhabdus hydrogeniphila]